MKFNKILVSNITISLAIVLLLIGVVFGDQTRECYKGDLEPNATVKLVNVKSVGHSPCVIKGEVCITDSKGTREYVFKNVESYSVPPEFVTSKGVSNCNMTQFNSPTDKEQFNNYKIVVRVYRFFGLRTIRLWATKL